MGQVYYSDNHYWIRFTNKIKIVGKSELYTGNETKTLLWALSTEEKLYFEKKCDRDENFLYFHECPVHVTVFPSACSKQILVLDEEDSSPMDVFCSQLVPSTQDGEPNNATFLHFQVGNFDKTSVSNISTKNGRLFIKIVIVKKSENSYALVNHTYTYIYIYIYIIYMYIYIKKINI